MDETQRKDQKWGFWLFMLHFFALDSIGRLLLREMLHTNETSISQYVISPIAIALTFGIRHALRQRPWKITVWTSWIIVTIWLLGYLLIWIKRVN